MPIQTKDDVSARGILPGVVQDAQYAPGFWDEVVPAAFRLENTIGSALSDQGISVHGEVDPNFDPFEFIRPGVDEEHADRYAFADNLGDVLRVQKQIDRETKDRDILSSAGGEGMAAAMMAGIIDPVNLIPVGGTAYKSYRSYRLGGSILKGAMTTAQASAVSMTASEAALQNTQLTRTYGESAANIAIGTIFGGILGAAAPTARAMFKNSGRSVEDVMAQMSDDLNVPVGGGSVGAARVKDLDAATSRTIEDEVRQMVKDGKLDSAEEGIEVGKRITAELLAREGMAKNWAVDGALMAVGAQDPTIRLNQSPSIVARALGHDLFESSTRLAKNEVGDASALPVEALIREYDSRMYRSMGELDDSFSQYVRGRSKRFGDIAVIEAQRLLGAGQGRLSYRQFREAVGKAARREDDITQLDGVPEDAIPHINRAARKYREEIYDPLRDKAIEQGLLPEDVDPKTAASYLNRVYDVDKLNHPEARAQFIDVTSEWLARRQSDAAERIKTAEGDVVALKEKLRAAKKAKSPDAAAIEKELTQREKLHARDLKEAQALPEELTGLAEEILQRIKGTSAGRLPYDMNIERVAGPRGAAGAKAAPLKQRVFNIPDVLIEDFLVNDIEIVSKRYIRSMAPDIELTAKFGDIEMTKQLKEIQDDYQNLMRQPGADTAKLTKKMNADLRDMTAIRDRMRNVYGVPDDPMSWQARTGRAFRQLNYVRLLGGMTPSAIPDIARPVMVHGFSRVFNDALKPLITNFASMGKLTSQLRDMGLASDIRLNSRMQQIADVTDDFSRASLPERMIGAASDTMGMVSLMAPWNTFFKQMSGAVTMNRVIRAIDAEIAGKITKKERTYLRENFIGAEEGRAIRKQLDAHGGEENGLTMPNALDWADRKAYSVFQAALQRDIDRTIVTPGQDKPLIATGSETGRQLFQFKSFAIAATQRIMISGLQQRDMAMLNGTLFAVFLGMASTAFKNWDAGRGEQMKDWTTEKWLIEGVDRSGVTGWLFEANNMMEKATRGNVGLSAVTGGQQMSRYASRNTAGAFLGPSFGTATGMLSVTGNASAAAFGEDKWKASDTRALRRLLPYQNLMLLRQVLDKAEAGVNSAIGAR